MSEFYGMAEADVIECIENGQTLTKIAGDCGKNRSILSRWLRADEQRSARAREARELAAEAWDDKAEEVLDTARDGFELSKAKELCHHYRWRASKIAPKTYGDKVEQTIVGPANVTISETDSRL